MTTRNGFRITAAELENLKQVFIAADVDGVGRLGKPAFVIAVQEGAQILEVPMSKNAAKEYWKIYGQEGPIGLRKFVRVLDSWRTAAISELASDSHDKKSWHSGVTSPRSVGRASPLSPSSSFPSPRTQHSPRRGLSRMRATAPEPAAAVDDMIYEEDETEICETGGHGHADMRSTALGNEKPSRPDSGGRGMQHAHSKETIGRKVGKWFGVVEDEEVAAWANRGALTTRSNRSLAHMGPMGNSQMLNSRRLFSESQQNLGSTGGLLSSRASLRRIGDNAKSRTFSKASLMSLVGMGGASKKEKNLTVDDVDWETQSIAKEDSELLVPIKVNDYVYTATVKHPSIEGAQLLYGGAQGSTRVTTHGAYLLVDWFSHDAGVKTPGRQRGARNTQSRAPTTRAQSRLYRGMQIKSMENFVKEQLVTRPEFKPYFMIVLSCVQVLMMIVMIAFGGIVSPSFTVKQETQGNITRTTAPNFWIGPPTETLIQFGAKYALCMRKDTAYQAWLAANREEPEGCCTEVNTCFRATEDACGAVWSSGACPSNCEISRRPCCIDIYGTCVTTDESDCSFAGGWWHSDQESCRDVNCLDDICGTAGSSDDPQNPNQWWRFITPMFLHAGLIHLGLNLLIQWAIMEPIERTAGWLRVGLIYVLSSVCGFAYSAVFIPYVPSVGASAAIYGIIGVHLVELFQQWQMLWDPWSTFFKLFLLVLFSLAIGLLPWIDNFAHVFGLIMGILTGLIFLPYLTFSKWDARRKRLMLAIAIPLALIVFAIAFIAFYSTQNPNFCSWCRYISCVPFTDDWCSDEYVDPYEDGRTTQ
eukprot:Clim_evm21s13 gene=Clim_evmTU21s13